MQYGMEKRVEQLCEYTHQGGDVLLCSESLALLKEDFRTEMKRLLSTIPQNAVKCLLFTVLAKSFKSLSVIGAKRCKRERKS